MIGYLAAFTYAAMIGWGALFFVLLDGLVDARWLAALRAPMRALSGLTVFLPILFIPVAVDAPHLYAWDALRGEVSGAGWGVRSGVVLAGLAAVALLVRRRTGRDREWPAALGMLSLFGLSMLASFDWLMELTPHFRSTIFGVIVIAAGAAGALGIASFLWARRAPQVCADFGTMMFATTMFWGYVSFMQLLIVWIGNLPHENAYYAERMTGAWPVVAGFLAAGGVATTMFLLLFRALKERPWGTATMGAWVACAQLLEAVWLVVPSAHGGGPLDSPFARVVGFVIGVGVVATCITVLFALERLQEPA